MAKKKATETKPAEGGRTGKRMHIYIPDDLMDALTAYQETCRPKPTVTGVINMLLEDFLKEKGHYTAAKKGK